MLGTLLRRLWYFIRRDRLGDELAEEMRLHMELREEALRREGLGGQEAHDAARRRFGNRTSLHQRSRDMWGFGTLDRVRQDLRYAIRRLVQRPGFSLAVIGVLALGVGATTAMFSAVDAAMLRPLPFHNDRELVTVRGIQIPNRSATARPANEPRWSVDLDDLAAMKDVFASAAIYATGGLNLADPERPQRVRVGVVTPGFFPTLGIAPARGRTFSEEEARADAPTVVVLSHALWTRQFNQADVLGRRIQLGSRSFEIVGVMPARFTFPDESDLWIPLTGARGSVVMEAFRGWIPAETIARTAPGISVEAAAERIRAMWSRLEAEYPKTPGRRSQLDLLLEEVRAHGEVTPLRQVLVGDRRSALLILLGATAVLLLIACANVTNLLLSQATMRRREIAVREVLGATRGRVIGQLLTESLVLSVLGAALGVALAPVALATMTAIMPAALAGVAPATVDLRVLGFAAALALVTGVGFGLWPALGTTRDAPGETIKTGGGVGSTITGARRARTVLVGAEIALTFILLVGAGLMLRSFERVLGLDAGIDRARVGTLELTMVRGMPAAVRLERINRILDRMSASAGIDAAGVVNDLPLRGTGGISIGVEADGMPRPEREDDRYVRWLTASSDYFEALGISLLRGRTFTSADDIAAPRVAVINETMAKRFWPGLDPIGRTFRSGAPDDPPATVIGVTADVRELTLESQVLPQMFFSAYREVPERMAIVARGELAPAVLLARMTDAVRAVDPAQAVFNVRMMDEVVDASVAPRRTNTVLITAFAGLALLLASLGVYAVIAYGVAQRSRELGIRAALGATAGNLVALISREMLWVIGIGLLVGAAGAWALARVMTSQLYGIDPHDTTTFLIVPTVLALTAIAATLGPAWRARQVDLVEVMRAE